MNHSVFNERKTAEDEEDDEDKELLNTLKVRSSDG